jgi:hypothetical protein
LCEASLLELGSRVRKPQACEHVSRDGQISRTYAGRSRPERTSDLFKQSIGRVSSADYMISIDDPQGGGAIVERQWAKQLGMPLFVIRLHGAVRPHDDSDGWNITISADQHQALEQLHREVMDSITTYTPRIADYRSARQSIEYKNASDLRYLQGAWKSLDDSHRRRAVQLAQVADERLDAYLSNGVAWDLASARERQAICSTLMPPPPPRGAFYEMRADQLKYIAEAAAELKIGAFQLLDATATIARGMALPRTRYVIDSVDSARTALRQSIRAPGWGRR